MRNRLSRRFPPQNRGGGADPEVPSSEQNPTGVSAEQKEEVSAEQKEKAAAEQKQKEAEQKQKEIDERLKDVPDQLTATPSGYNGEVTLKRVGNSEFYVDSAGGYSTYNPETKQFEHAMPGFAKARIKGSGVSQEEMDEAWKTAVETQAKIDEENYQKKYYGSNDED